MLRLLRHLTALGEFCLWMPRRIVRWLMTAIAFNPKLGPVRHVLAVAVVYALFALLRQEIDVVYAQPIQAPAPARHEPPRLAEDQLSADDRAFNRRIAPPAAE
jgi:hypothetical protein